MVFGGFLAVIFGSFQLHFVGEVGAVYDFLV
jgi:hypothetical protein